MAATVNGAVVEQQKLSKDEFLELYSVDGPLGQGAFGAVMRGTDRHTEQDLTK
mgnify:CR=1